mmetsp:Transcript_33891/g.79383  ORF Transcript_33891/g.79383 Transcript_33891/m.79383 type:complete len:360 (-) Transcript_33891:83-1162(-)
MLCSSRQVLPTGGFTKIPISNTPPHPIPACPPTQNSLLPHNYKQQALTGHKPTPLDLHGALVLLLGLGSPRLGPELGRPPGRHGHVLLGRRPSPLASLARHKLDGDQTLLLGHLDDLGVDAGAEEGLVPAQAGGLGPHLVGGVDGLEDHRIPELAASLLGEVDALHLGELLAGVDEAELLERGVEVRVVAVPVPGHVLPDLAERLRRLLLVQLLRLGGRLDRHGEDLSVLEGEAAEGDGQAVDEAQRGHAVAVGEVGVEGSESDDQAEPEHHLGEGEATDLEGSLALVRETTSNGTLGKLILGTERERRSGASAGVGALVRQGKARLSGLGEAHTTRQAAGSARHGGGVDGEGVGGVGR